MALIVMCAAKGAPGVTVSSLALTLSWWRSALMVECDPSGGSVQAGYLAGQLPADRGLAHLAVADRHGQLFESFGGQLVDLGTDNDGHERWLLPGISDPATGAGLGPVWPRLATYFSQLETASPPLDVIADCGRIPSLHAPMPLLHQADIVVLVLERTMASVVAARPRVLLLQRLLEQHGTGLLRLALRGDGPYSSREISAELGVPTLAELPDDPRTARMLSRGDGTPRSNATLLRAARSAQDSLHKLVATRRMMVSGLPGMVGHGH